MLQWNVREEMVKSLLCSWPVLHIALFSEDKVTDNVIGALKLLFKLLGFSFKM